MLAPSRTLAADAKALQPVDRHGDGWDDLDQINDYSVQYHHGEDPSDATPDQIDPTALKGYARRTLKIINALQA